MTDQPFWRSRPDRPVIIAHRGASSLAPENTRLAAELAHAAGADAWELDVNLTADGVPVVIHDSNLTRTTDAARVYPDRKPWTVSDFTLAELQRLDCGAWFREADPHGEAARGGIAPEELDRCLGQRMLTLAQALELTVELDWAVNVELKDLRRRPGHNRVVDLVVEEIDRAGAADRVLISSFNHDYLAQVRQRNKHLALGVLAKHRTTDPAGLVAGLGAQTFHTSRQSFEPAACQDAARRGVPSFAYVVNDRAEMLDLHRQGMGGVFTDRPQVAGRLMKEEPEAD